MIGFNCAGLTMTVRWTMLKSDVMIVEEAKKFRAFVKLKVTTDDFRRSMYMDKI